MFYSGDDPGDYSASPPAGSYTGVFDSEPPPGTPSDMETPGYLRMAPQPMYSDRQQMMGDLAYSDGTPVQQGTGMEEQVLDVYQQPQGIWNYQQNMGNSGMLDPSVVVSPSMMPQQLFSPRRDTPPSILQGTPPQLQQPPISNKVIFQQQQQQQQQQQFQQQQLQQMPTQFVGQDKTKQQRITRPRQTSSQLQQQQSVSMKQKQSSSHSKTRTQVSAKLQLPADSHSFHFPSSSPEQIIVTESKKSPRSRKVPSKSSTPEVAKLTNTSKKGSPTSAKKASKKPKKPTVSEINNNSKSRTMTFEAKQANLLEMLRSSGTKMLEINHPDGSVVAGDQTATAAEAAPLYPADKGVEAADNESDAQQTDVETEETETPPQSVNVFEGISSVIGDDKIDVFEPSIPAERLQMIIFMNSITMRLPLTASNLDKDHPAPRVESFLFSEFNNWCAKSFDVKLSSTFVVGIEVDKQQCTDELHRILQTFSTSPPAKLGPPVPDPEPESLRFMPCLGIFGSTPIDVGSQIWKLYSSMFLSCGIPVSLGPAPNGILDYFLNDMDPIFSKWGVVVPLPWKGYFFGQQFVSNQSSEGRNFVTCSSIIVAKLFFSFICSRLFSMDVPLTRMRQDQIEPSKSPQLQEQVLKEAAPPTLLRSLEASPMSGTPSPMVIKPPPRIPSASSKINEPDVALKTTSLSTSGAAGNTTSSSITTTVTAKSAAAEPVVTNSIGNNAIGVNGAGGIIALDNEGNNSVPVMYPHSINPLRSQSLGTSLMFAPVNPSAAGGVNVPKAPEPVDSGAFAAGPAMSASRGAESSVSSAAATTPTELSSAGIDTSSKHGEVQDVDSPLVVPETLKSSLSLSSSPPQKLRRKAPGLITMDLLPDKTVTSPTIENLQTIVKPNSNPFAGHLSEMHITPSFKPGESRINDRTRGLGLKTGPFAHLNAAETNSKLREHRPLGVSVFPVDAPPSTDTSSSSSSTAAAGTQMNNASGKVLLNSKLMHGGPREIAIPGIVNPEMLKNAAPATLSFMKRGGK